MTISELIPLMPKGVLDWSLPSSKKIIVDQIPYVVRAQCGHGPGTGWAQFVVYPYSFVLLSPTSFDISLSMKYLCQQESRLSNFSSAIGSFPTNVHNILREGTVVEIISEWPIPLRESSLPSFRIITISFIVLRHFLGASQGCNGRLTRSLTTLHECSLVQTVGLVTEALGVSDVSKNII